MCCSFLYKYDTRLLKTASSIPFFVNNIQMASLNEEITANAENFQRTFNAQTNMDRLAKCTIDLRDARIDPCEDLSAISQLFIITLIHNNKNYDA